MLFNSYVYIFLFLPLTYVVYRSLAARQRALGAIGVLVIASLIYYGWWNPAYLFLIVGSMVFNFTLGSRLRFLSSERQQATRKTLLIIGICVNLGALAYFKYAGFLISTANSVVGVGLDVPNIVLPLAISFFTFQQIAYLVDVYRNEAHEYRFVHYALFVTFFPQLIAGPIVHHKEMMPQFDHVAERDRLHDFAVGSSIFFIGLFKKVVLADSVAPFANQVFGSAAAGEELTLFVAWGGVLSYTLQLYFDFSGYSDMAIGSARVFGIRLPLNFHSPYKALNISEFWRRWHMTLSRFLRDYVYIALGGNRQGPARRYMNLFATMLIGGLWHGAGWTFVVWGGLHGLYLVVNHAWARLGVASRMKSAIAVRLYRFFAWSITFLAVIVGWVFFRATDFSTAWRVLEAMAGLNGAALPNAIVARLGSIGDIMQHIGIETFIGGGSDFTQMTLWVAGLMLVAVWWPNTQQIMREFDPALMVHPPSDENALKPMRLTAGLRFQFNLRWAIALSLTTVVSIMALNRVSEFLYYQF